MPRFYGEVGYGDSVEQAPGVWEDVMTERQCYGDIVRKDRSIQDGLSVNGNIQIGNQISVLIDEYAIENFSKIKYVKWEGVRWSVTTVAVNRPRLLLTLGEVYNGPTP